MTNTGKPLTALVHVHAGLMTLWILMLIAQAWLVRAKRYAWHRSVGRSSFVIAPVIIVFSFVVVRNGILRTGEDLTAEHARIRIFRLGMTLAFAVTWGLAIANRRHLPRHVRYMVSTVFAVGSAIVFRIIGTWLAWVPGLGTPAGIVAANWAVLTLPLLALIALDWRRSLKRSPFWVVTILIAVIHVGYFTFTKTDWWFTFVRWIGGMSA